MLYLVTGTPGAKKTAFVVSRLDRLESQNKANIVLNKNNFLKNKKIIEQYDLQSEFAYLNYEVGSGHTLQNKVKAFDDDYFAMFEQDFDDLRPDDYFKRSVEYNQIILRITENQGIKGLLGLAPVRTIYTNINALKIDFVRSNVYDWRECPDGSLIVIDEVQLVEPFDKVKDKTVDIVQDLTIHRHRGFDFYFITQAPMLLHPTIKALIGTHYHLTVPYGLRTLVYQYGSTRDNPSALVNKLNCEQKFSFNPPDRIFKLYKSTTINTHENRIPYKALFVFGFFLLCCFGLFYSQLDGVKKSAYFDDTANQTKAVDKKENSNNASLFNPNLSQTNDNPQQIPQQPQTQPAPPPPPALPMQAELEQKYLQSYTVEVVNIDTVRPALVAQMGNECRAYNQYGDLLNIDDNLCKSMLKEYGLKPKARQVFSDYANTQYNDLQNAPMGDNGANMGI